DQFGNLMATPPSFTWSLGSGSVGTLSSTGLYTAPASGSGSAVVRAVSGTIAGTASVTVRAVNQAPTVAAPASASPSPVSGTTTTLSVRGADDSGEASLTYTWSVLSKPSGAANPTFSVNGSNAAKNTVATFSQAGSYTFR